METLKNHTLIYDSECPMCDLYTSGFVKTGMLDANGRVEYGCARVPASFDNERARDEIALVDYETGTVTYGLDSLIKVIGHSFPWIAKAMKLNVLRWFLQQLYYFISYNRKVIAPPKVFEKRGSCTPAYHKGYRIAYIVFAWLVSCLILSDFRREFFPLVLYGNQYAESASFAAFIIVQMVIMRLTSPAKVLHYLGNTMTVVVIGTLLLLPILIMSSIITIPPALPIIWFGMVVTFMIYLHWKRAGMLGVSWMSVTWVGYIVFALWIYLK